MTGGFRLLVLSSVYAFLRLSAHTKASRYPMCKLALRRCNWGQSSWSARGAARTPPLYCCYYELGGTGTFELEFAQRVPYQSRHCRCVFQSAVNPPYVKKKKTNVFNDKFCTPYSKLVYNHRAVLLSESNGRHLSCVIFLTLTPRAWCFQLMNSMRAFSTM